MMADVNPPKDDSLGDDYSRGPNPNPGGDIDTGDSVLPPYEDRSTGNAEVREGIPRAFGDEPPLREPNEPAAPDDDTAGTQAPKDVGVSTTRGGEDLSKSHHDGKEAGRHDTGTTGATDRPTGESDARDETSIGPG
jgi:hypothetical protein